MSEPVLGSVIPRAHTISPLMISGRYRRFCTSLPKRVSHGDDMSVCTSTLKATPPERQRAISSPRTTLDRKSPPAPPYSTGNSSPRKPSSPRRRQNAFGICPTASHSSTRGTTSFSTKARTLFRSIRCSSVNISILALLGRGASLDDLVGAMQKRGRDREPERLGGLEIDNQLELRRLLYGEIRGLGALEDLVHVDRGAPPDVRQSRAVGHEGPGFRILPLRKDRRQPVLSREICESCSVGTERWICHDEERAHALLGQGRERAVELRWPPRLQELKLQPQRPRRALDVAYGHRSGGAVRVREDGHTPNLRDGFLEQLQVFAENVRTGDVGHSRHVPTRARE